MQTKQVYNPFLPLHEYITDVEPHVFGERVYIYAPDVVQGNDGREACDMLNMTGTTNGSLELINGNRCIFYYRLTHKSDYSRQVCAQKVTINTDGSID